MEGGMRITFYHELLRKEVTWSISGPIDFMGAGICFRYVGEIYYVGFEHMRRIEIIYDE